MSTNINIRIIKASIFRKIRNPFVVIKNLKWPRFVGKLFQRAGGWATAP